MNTRMKDRIVLGFVSLLLFSLPAKVLAQVAITAPAPNSTLSGTVSFACSNPGGTVGLYIDEVWLSNGPYSWNTTKSANGTHSLLCNGYIGGKGIGGTSEAVIVANGVSTPTVTPTVAPT